MITDPLTLELGEIRSTAATAFYEEGPFAVRATVFDGELDNADSIENAAVWFSFSPIDILTLGFSAVTDIGEGGYADDINDVLAEGGSYDKTAGISAFIFLELDKISVSAEYLCAASDMTLTDADDEVSDWRPQAWFVELGYAFSGDWSGALRYEGSRNFMTEDMPVKQFGGMLTYAFNEFATLSAEYLFGQFDADVDDRHIATLQLAVAF